MNARRYFSILLMLCMAVSISFAAPKKGGQGKSVMLFDYEVDLDGWRIPEWAFAKKDNAAAKVLLSKEQAFNGTQSLKIVTNFMPKMWSGAYCEVEREPGNFMDFTGYDTLMVDVYVPKEAPRKLTGEIVLTVGEDWSWTEMRKGIELVPGQWTTVTANITPESLDWKAKLTEALISDVRKLGVRVASNYMEYKGQVYVDGIRLGKSGKK